MLIIEYISLEGGNENCSTHLNLLGNAAKKCITVALGQREFQGAQPWYIVNVHVFVILSHRRDTITSV